MKKKYVSPCAEYIETDVNAMLLASLPKVPGETHITDPAQILEKRKGTFGDKSPWEVTEEE